MRYTTIALIAVVAFSRGTNAAEQAPAATGPSADRVKLGPLPAVTLLPRPATATVSDEGVKALIADLSLIDKPEFGLSGTLSGSGFAPLPGQGKADAMVLTDHGLATSPALADLVKLGPVALPSLLDALDDPTPTKIAVPRNAFGFGGMWFSGELPANPASPAERAVGGRPGGGWPGRGDAGRSYTVRVGDVCFVAVGQIVGRPYTAVRYQPTAIIVINSPVRDPKLCATVRSLWHSADPRRMLFESLRADYATIDGPGDRPGPTADEFECGAAMRMLYYFPRETETLIADRIDHAEVSDDFIKAVAWSRLPRVRVAVTSVFRRSHDLKRELAAVSGVDDDALVRSRLEPELQARMQPDSAMYDDGRPILTALLERSPETASWAFEQYLARSAAQGRVTACSTLTGTTASWSTEVLQPMLSDTRPDKWREYEPAPGQHDHRLPIRVCDAAAATLSSIHPNLKFALEGDYANLDRQITTMRVVLERR